LAFTPSEYATKGYFGMASHKTVPENHNTVTSVDCEEEGIYTALGTSVTEKATTLRSEHSLLLDKRNTQQCSLDDENGSFPDFVHVGNHITNQSENEDECSEDVNITSVLFLSSNTKDDTKEDFLLSPNQLPSSEYLLGKNDTGIYMKERENLGLAINDLYLPVSPKQDRKSLKTTGKNTRIKYVIDESVFFLAGLNKSGPVSY